ncbi:DUF3644 domain-containing protein [Pimelobacter simplex]|uniref:DUF3644 domain-containing protein n=1 Tax=Nocardioides simplex TaxID=2045 RepID=UPI002FFD19DF
MSRGRHAPLPPSGDSRCPWRAAQRAGTTKRPIWRRPQLDECAVRVNKRLADNSLSAMLSAVEIYNKPQMTYRDEVTVMLVVNAWELALNATLRQKNRSIFHAKQRGERYLSIGIDHALGRVTANNLRPADIDGPAVTATSRRSPSTATAQSTFTTRRILAR